MPCVSDYQEPNAREKEAGRVARFLNWLCSSFMKEGRPLPEFTVDSHYRKAFQQGYLYNVPQSKLDEWTDALCRLVRSFSEEEQNKYLYNGRVAQSRQLAEWWERHQEADARREKDRAERDKLANLQASALQKLTDAERRALGW